MHRFSLALILFGIGSPLWAQQAFTVDEAVTLALRNNPQIVANARDIDAARSGARSAKALTNPTMLFAPGITSVSGSDEEFLFQQPLEVNGTRRARTEVAQATLQNTQAQAALTQRDIVFQAKTAYFGLVRARELSTIARSLLTNAEESDRVARRQVELGTRPGIDLAQTGIEVARAKRQVTLADSEAQAALTVFNRILGRKPSEPVEGLLPITDLSRSLPSIPGAGTDEEEALVAQALANHPEVQSEEALANRFRGEARLARAEGNPDIAPQVRVGNFTRGLPPASSGSGAGIALSISLPLLDHGSRKERIRQAEQSTLAQEARIQAARNTVQQEVTEALVRLRSAQSVVKDYQAGVLDQAKRLLEGNRRGFQEGRVTVVALLEAQRSYIAVQTEYVNSLSDVATAGAALERALAAPLPVPSGGTKS